jgi:response regulator RpfG family c-di-GMP phosphodiesterase
MAKGKNVLTTGDVARICNVAPRTVSKWFDSGQLKGYRIPGSKDRRIPVNELVRFMREHNMPADMLGAGRIRVLLVDNKTQQSLTLADRLKTQGDYDIQMVSSNFESGAVAQKFAPHIMLINLLAEGIDAADICKNIRSSEEMQTIKIFAMANHLNKSETAALIEKGFDGFISDDADIKEVIRKIEEATAIIY